MAGCLGALHAVGFLAAWVYATQPRFHWLQFLLDYQFLYLVGCWTVLHITWNWPAKQVRGVQVGY